MGFSRDVVVVGGCGHVGLPLGLALADRGVSVTLFDLNEHAVRVVNSGRIPFDEPGAAAALHRTLGRTLEATTDASTLSSAECIIVVVGTPIDEHLTPNPKAVLRAVEDLADHLVDGQLLILRSTVYPGVTALMEKLIARLGLGIDVAFCPERIAEGRAMVELAELPQIVSSRTERGVERAEALFKNLTRTTVRLEPEEAELAKLFTNTWRYIKFAIANQCYMIANDLDVDFERVRHALAFDYPRAADFPRAGFAAGPCLLKDTMQLAALNENNFSLGHAAMAVNEGLPLYLIGRIEDRFDLSEMVVGILGMSFKPESDDIRSSLSYKLKRVLEFKAQRVMCTDPYVRTDLTLLPLDDVMREADLLVVGTPHACYAALQPQVPVIDVWGHLSESVRV